MTDCRGNLAGSGRLLVALVAALACLAGGHDSQAEEPLRYRRIFVPEDALPREIRGLLPLQREEFERRAAQASQKEQAMPAGETRVTRAEYHARLVGNRYLQGSAELEIECNASAPQVMPLGACNMALASARWRSAAERPAVVGQDGSGQLGCLVSESGTLLWDWSLQRGAGAAAITFSLQLPPATVSTLRLELAADQVLLAEGGIVTPGSENSPPPAGKSAPPTTRTWLVEVGGSPALNLTIQTRTTGGDSPPLIAVREESSYSILRSSLDLDCTLQIETFEQSLPNLKLLVDRPLQITRIRAGEQTLRWTVSGSGDDGVLVTIASPEAAVGPNFSLEIQATAPWSADAPAALPRVVVQDTVYQEGRTTIAAAPELGLQAKPLRGAWQSAVTPAVGGRGNDQMQFRLHEARAQIEIAADLAPAGLQEITGTQFIVDGTKVSAVMTAELTSLGGNYFAVEATVPRRWIIDAVEVEPAEALSDRTLTADAPNRQLLRLNLRLALQPARPLRVVVRAHHRRPSGSQTFDVDFHRLAVFADVRSARRLVAVRTTEAGTRLTWTGDERLTRVDPSQLPEPEMRLFETIPGTVVFVDDDGAAGMTASLTAATPAYRIEAALEAVATRQQVHQSLQLRCIPESTPVEQIVVHMFPRPASSPTWKLMGDDRRELSVTRLTPQDGAASDAEAIYRLTLVSPRSAPFTIQAQWDSSAKEAVALSLAAAPDATRQAGMVTVRSLDGTPLLIESDGMQTLPIADESSEQFSTLRGRYSYRPGRRAGLRVLAAQRTASLATVRVESLHVQSRFSVDGKGEHAASLRIANQGATRLDLRLPFTAQDLRLVDGSTGIVLPLPRTSSGQVTIPLPAGQRLALVQVRYTSERTPLGWWPTGRFQAPLPELQVAPLRGTWSVAVCPGLQFSDPPGRKPGAPSTTEQTSPRSLAVTLGGFTRTTWNFTTSSDDIAIPQEIGLTGWTHTELELPSGPLATIRVVRSQVVQCLGIVAFLLLALAIWRLGPQAGTWVWLGAIVLIPAAMVTPSQWSPITSGLALGAIVGGLGLLLRSRLPDSADARARNLLRRGMAVLIFAVLVGVAGSSRLRGDDPAAPGGDSRPAAADHRVVIATDEGGQPVGDYVYLSPQFYERLLKLTSTESAPLPDWLLTSAQYQLPRPPHLTGAAPSLEEIDLRIDLITFREAVQVVLPFRRDQVSLLEARARLDGEPVAVTWREDGVALLLPVATVGKHQLQLACGAALQKNDDAAVLNLTVPMISQSTVSTPLALETQPTIVAASSVLAASDSAWRHYAIGPTARLIAQWPAQGAVPTAAQVEVDQLTWWKLKPGSVVVRGKFRFRPLGGTLRQVELEVDPRLQIVPGSITPASAALEITSGPRQTIRIVPLEKTESEFTLTADWLWPGASGAGNLTLPRIAARGDRVLRSWTAMSVDPALTIEGAAGLAGKSVAGDDFLIAWSEPELPPALAAEDSSGLAAHAVTLLPATPEPIVSTSARWTVGAQQATVAFHAHLSQIPAARFRHELDLPPTLKVQQVRLTAGGTTLPHRWRQRPDGSVVITLLTAPPAEQVLELDGMVARARNRPRLPLPNMSMLNARTGEVRVQIYGHPQVAVRLQTATGWEQQPESEGAPGRSDEGRLVADLHRAAGRAAAAPVVAINPNRPQVSHDLALRVADVQGQWTATADVELSVAVGALDQIRLEVPAEWTGPFSITPAAPHRVVPMPGTTVSQLLIFPEQAISESYHLQIAGPIQSRSSEPVRAPAVAVLDSQADERTLVLDTRLAQQLSTWETRGLQAVAPTSLHLPKGWSDDPDQEYYRVVAESFAAIASLPAATPARPVVSLAEIDLTGQGGGRFLGQARFLVQPPAAGDLVLEMPPHSRLIQVSQNGVHCQCRAEGLRTWRIAVNSLGVPTSLELVFDGILPATAVGEGRFRWTPPRLRALPIMQSLWTLSGLEFIDSLGDSAAPLESTSELAAAVVRCEVLAQHLDRLADLQSPDLPLGVLAEVYSRGESEYQSAKSLAEERLRQSPPAAEWSRRLSRADQTARSASRRMDQAGIVIRPAGEPVLATGSMPQREVLIGAGWPEAIIVREMATSEPADHRYSAAAIVAALLGGLLLLLRSAAVRDAFAAHAPAIVAAAGLGWWLLAPWALLGWVVIALAIWLAVGSPWRKLPSSSFPRAAG